MVPAVAVEGFRASASVPKRKITNNADYIIVSSDEELDFCDQDSVASSVDSLAEDMFIDDMDPILDWWVFVSPLNVLILYLYYLVIRKTRRHAVKIK